eukprot:evm.model.scf_376EXC.5 EVM.evm.TU.scf_376EXC.5   scf_376EXC:50420-62632(+)
MAPGEGADKSEKSGEHGKRAMDPQLELYDRARQQVLARFGTGKVAQEAARKASQEEAASSTPPSSTPASSGISSDEQAAGAFEAARKFQDDQESGCSTPGSRSPHEREETSQALEWGSGCGPWNVRESADASDDPLYMFCQNGGPPHDTARNVGKSPKPSPRRVAESPKLPASRSPGNVVRRGNSLERQLVSRRRDAKRAGAAAQFPDLSEDEEIEMITSALNAAPSISDGQQYSHGGGGDQKKEAGVKHGAGFDNIPQCDSPAVPERRVAEPNWKKRNVGKGSKGRTSSPGFLSNSFGKQRKSGGASHKFYESFRVKRHRPSVPDFKFSQPRSAGQQAPLRQVGWSFDEAHPALAEGHYLRTPQQNRMLEDEKWLVATNAKFEALRKERESKKAFFGNLKRMASSGGRQSQTRGQKKNGRTRCMSAPCDMERGGGGRTGHRNQTRYAEKIAKLKRSIEELRKVKTADGAPPADFSECSDNQDEDVPPGGGSETDDDHAIRLAHGTFDEARFSQHSLSISEAMRERAARGYRLGDLERGYESDLERDREERQREETLRCSETVRDAEEELMREREAKWADDDRWMDAYRVALPLREENSSQAGAQVDGDCGHQPLSKGDLAMLDSSFIPIASPALRSLAMSDGEAYRRTISGRDASGRKLSRGRPRSASRPFTPTQQKPFRFEERARERPRTIMGVKTEQDVHIKRMEAEAARRGSFRANPIPKSTREPRFENILWEQDFRRRTNHDAAVEVLNQMQAPFSFYERDKLAAQERSRRMRKDPKRFQVPFKAKDVPKHVKEGRYSLLLAEAEARKIRARALAREKLAMVQMPPRMEAAEREQPAAKTASDPKARPRGVDPAWNTKYPSRRLGEVPDFAAMHMQWAHRQATARSANRARVTVPQGPYFSGRGAKGDAQHRRRIQNDSQCHDEHLPEQRWPFVSSRRKVHSTPPPDFSLEPSFKVSDTRANRLRARSIRKLRRRGKYASQEERELMEAEKLRRESERRAKLYVRMQQAKARSLGLTPAPPTATEKHTLQQPEPDISSREPKRDLENRKDTPAQHIKARHKQVEQQAREIVEEVLLEQGLDVYKYMEQ